MRLAGASFRRDVDPPSLLVAEIGGLAESVQPAVVVEHIER